MILNAVLKSQSLYRGWSGARGLASIARKPDSLVYEGNTYPYRWLRDSCQCPECVHPANKQKLHRTTDIPADVQPASDGVRSTGSGLDITWSGGHKSSFPASFLQTYASPAKLHQFHRDVDPVSWDRSSLPQSTGTLFISYEELHKPSGLLASITQLTQYGLLIVTGVPHQETSNEACETKKLAEMFGETKSTFYGELWDVINIRNGMNIAYTNLFLGLHMDLMYFHNPPRFQLLHCLRNRVIGGESVFSDALNAAERLRASHPSEFKLLATTPVPFHYVFKGYHLHKAHPTIVLDECHTGDVLTAPIKCLAYAPPFQAPLPPSTRPEFYTALERFTEYIEEPAAKFQYLLREGDAVFFDNQRVLHSRTGFSDDTSASAGAAGEPNRWLKGTYVDADTMLSRGRILREGA